MDAKTALFLSLLGMGGSLAISGGQGLVTNKLRQVDPTANEAASVPWATLAGGGAGAGLAALYSKLKGLPIPPAVLGIGGAIGAGTGSIIDLIRNSAYAGQFQRRLLKGGLDAADPAQMQGLTDEDLMQILTQNPR